MIFSEKTKLLLLKTKGINTPHDALNKWDALENAEKDGNKLKPNCFKITEDKYAKLTDEAIENNLKDIELQIHLQQLKKLSVIRNCVVFFTALVVIAIVIYFFAFLNMA